MTITTRMKLTDSIKSDKMIIMIIKVVFKQQRQYLNNNVTIE